MCGICGVWGFEDRALIKRMSRSMAHRGPDGVGYFVDKNLMMGNRRLSVIDLVTGDQPIYNEDRSVCVVDNGEIYNFREIRKSLEKKGHKFYTSTDTEVVVHAYEEYGPDCFSKFNGMFSIALWDSNKKHLLLARDRNGMKPLYYTELRDGSLLFASEVKAILQHEMVPKELSKEAFHFFINLRYVPRGMSMFKGIHRLLPGHYLLISNGKKKTFQFHKPGFHIAKSSEAHFIRQLRAKLENAVTSHMISDVPIGISLSGGLDSSVIVALATKVSDEVRTFCMGFGEDADEIEDANFIADHFKTNHRNLIVKTNLLKEYPKMIWYADAPKRNLYPYYLAELLSRNIKVALGGLGGDELFGGYIWKYRYAQDVERIRRSKTKRELQKLIRNAKGLIEFQAKQGMLQEDRHLEYLKKLMYLDSNADLYLSIQSLDEVFTKEFQAKIYGKELLRSGYREIRDVFAQYFVRRGDLIRQFMEADFQIKMVDDFLFVEDAMSSAHSLESRAPFLDNELVDLAFSIPHTLKWSNGVGKYIYRKAVKPLLPKEVFEKRKQGFGSNVYLTYLDEIHEIAKQRLPDGNAVKEGLIQKRFLNRLLRQSPTPELTKYYCFIWNLLTFEIWYDIYMKSDTLRKPKLDASRFF